MIDHAEYSWGAVPGVRARFWSLTALLQCEYLVGEIESFAPTYPDDCAFSDAERYGSGNGQGARGEVVCFAKPETMRGVVSPSDRPQVRRPCASLLSQVSRASALNLEAGVLRIAQENSDLGYDRIEAALANLVSHPVSDHRYRIYHVLFFLHLEPRRVTLRRQSPDTQPKAR